MWKAKHTVFWVVSSTFPLDVDLCRTRANTPSTPTQLVPLGAQLAEREQLPFDGMLLDARGLRTLFDPSARKDWDQDGYAADVADLGKAQSAQLTDNFLITYPRGNQDWASDEHWDIITHNTTLIARAARLGGCAGLWFDPEVDAHNWEPERMPFRDPTKTFADFQQSDIEVLEKALRVHDYPRDHVFGSEGEKDSSMYLIIRGEVQRSRKRPHARGFEYQEVLKSGDLFGLRSLIDNQPRFSTCRALTEVTAASLPRSAFNLLYHSHVGIAEHFQFIVARQLARELRALDRDLVRALTSGRVEDFLNPPTSEDVGC